MARMPTLLAKPYPHVELENHVLVGEFIIKRLDEVTRQLDDARQVIEDLRTELADAKQEVRIGERAASALGSMGEELERTRRERDDQTTRANQTQRIRDEWMARCKSAEGELEALKAKRRGRKSVG